MARRVTYARQVDEAHGAIRGSVLLCVIATLNVALSRSCCDLACPLDVLERLNSIRFAILDQYLGMQVFECV
jgi:hypothetical protein